MYHNFKIDYYFSFDFKFIPIPLSSLFVSSRNLKYSCYKANGHTQSSSASNSQVVMETPSSTTPSVSEASPPSAPASESSSAWTAAKPSSLFDWLSKSSTTSPSRGHAVSPSPGHGSSSGCPSSSLTSHSASQSSVESSAPSSPPHCVHV